jgi:hypothetical protein
MGQMGVNDENILREKAREAIASGKLPMRKAHRALGGLGTGRTCALCGGLLTPTQMEIEIELNPLGSAHGLPRYYLHPRCFAAWELEIDSKASAQAPAATSRLGELFWPPWTTATSYESD